MEVYGKHTVPENDPADFRLGAKGKAGTDKLMQAKRIAAASKMR